MRTSDKFLLAVTAGAMLAFGIAAFAQTPSPTPPIAADSPPPAIAPIVSQAPSPKPSATPDYMAGIKTIVSGSKCPNYSFLNRGRPSFGYIQGVALVYARQVCNPDSPIAKIASKPFTTDKVHDAFALYGTVQANPLRQTFNLLIGLGMRESSGKLCCGRDMSANFTSADSAEAGAWQTSWGARRASSALPDLYKAYSLPNGPKCFTDIFKAGVSCSVNDAKNWGTGDGLKWQALTKSCPAFAAEYASALIRTLGGSLGEFGPLRRKQAEMNPDCDSMLRAVAVYVQANPGVCKLL